MPDQYQDKIKDHDRAMKAHAFVSASIRLCSDALRLVPDGGPELEKALSLLVQAKHRLSRKVKAIGAA